MGQIRKINDVYYIEFHARGLLYSQVAGSNLEEAKNLLLQVEEKIAGGEALTITRYIDLAPFFERFQSEVRTRHSPQSVKRYAAVINHFSGFLNDNFPQVHQLAQLTPAIIESYKVYLSKTQRVKIVNFTILLIRDILEYGIKLGFINDNPSLHVRLLPWPKSFGQRQTARYNQVKQLLSKGIGLGKLAQVLGLSDVAQVLYYADLIPLKSGLFDAE